MSNWKFESKYTALLLGASLVVALGAAGCGSADNANKAAVPTPQGTISLDNVKVGMPESTFKEAILTFVQDPDPRASVGGRTQYLSRPKDSNGGQYVVQCVGGQCDRIMVYYQQTPIGRDLAVKTLKQLFPADAPATATTDDTGLKGATPVSNYTFSDQYKGQLVCTDKSGNQVKIIAASVTQKAQ